VDPPVVGRDWSPVSSNKARGCCSRTTGGHWVPLHITAEAPRRAAQWHLRVRGEARADPPRGPGSVLRQDHGRRINISLYLYLDRSAKTRLRLFYFFGLAVNSLPCALDLAGRWLCISQLHDGASPFLPIGQVHCGGCAFVFIAHHVAANCPGAAIHWPLAAS
jgi:hypothetical protein